MNFIDKLEQLCVEDMYSKKQSTELIMKDIESGMEDSIFVALSHLFNYFNGKYYDSKNIRIKQFISDNPCKYLDIVNMILVVVLPIKKTITIQNCVSKLYTQFEGGNQWDTVKTVAEIVTVVGSKSGLYNIIKPADSTSGSIELEPCYSLEEVTIKTLDRFKYLPPHVHKPDNIYKNYQSAYVSQDNSMILGSGNHHEKYLALDAINIANGIRLSLDPWVLTQEEESKKPLDTPDKVDNFNNHVKIAKETYEEIVDKYDNSFYLSWRFCKRGRIYCSGHHVTIQGNEYKKALINLHKKELIRLT